MRSTGGPVNGFLFGLTTGQFAVLGAAGMPVLAAFNARAWGAFGVCVVGWVLVGLATVVDVQGRTAVGWLAAAARAGVGRRAGWSRWQSRVLAGLPVAEESLDLPGVMAGLRVHDGAPTSPRWTRPGLIEDRARGTWSITAALRHPGLGAADGDTRDGWGAGLGDLLRAAATGQMITQVALTVRTSPDDGAERAKYLTDTMVDSPVGRAVAPVVLGLEAAVQPACTTTEGFVTVTTTRTRLAREARHSGRGAAGRSHVLAGMLREAGTHLDGMGCEAVTPLSTPQLSEVIRTGFAPADRAELTRSHTAAAAAGPPYRGGIPPGHAGPGQAHQTGRYYYHDGWVTCSIAVRLPDGGARLGALAPVLAPSTPGERRAMSVFYAVTDQATATRSAGHNSHWAGVGAALRARLQITTRPGERRAHQQVETVDAKLAEGQALSTGTAIVAVTVPDHWEVGEYEQRLAGSVRSAGFVPQPVRFSTGAGFTAAVQPLGLGVARARARS